MALVIPPEVVVNILVNIPNIPSFLYPSKQAWYNKFPKDVIGIDAPTPAKSIKYSYIPKKLNIAPTTTKILVICPGVNLVLSKIISPINEIVPTNIKALI